MFQKKKLNVAILAALAASGQQATAEIEEIIVTATKRAVPLQDAPVTIQAIGSRELEDQNIQEFSDYVKYLPNVNAGGRGPGQNEIYIRGAAVDAINITVAESQGSAPNVALYLDEQPVTAGGRNLDVYISDMERIEVLPGPQGTLYGASSMAGTVRLITSKPVIDEFDASFNGSWSADLGWRRQQFCRADAELPHRRLASWPLASRSTTIVKAASSITSPALSRPTACHQPYLPWRFHYLRRRYCALPMGPSSAQMVLTVPVIKGFANNAGLVEDDFNDAHYAGARFGVKYLINDDWSLLLVQHTAQSLSTEGCVRLRSSAG